MYSLPLNKKELYLTSLRVTPSYESKKNYLEDSLTVYLFNKMSVIWSMHSSVLVFKDLCTSSHDTSMERTYNSVIKLLITHMRLKSLLQQLGHIVWSILSTPQTDNDFFQHQSTQHLPRLFASNKTNGNSQGQATSQLNFRLISQ